MKGKSGFSLVEIMIVVLIIGTLSTIVFVNVGKSKARARDSIRLSDMKTLVYALEMHFNEYGHYPGQTFEGVSNSGEMIGDNDGPIEECLAPYVKYIPADPIHDGINYQYCYDPQDATPEGTGAVLAFYQAETDTFPLQKDTTQGGNMGINRSDYNVAFFPPGP